MHQKPTLTVSQAARELGVPAATLRRWTRQGRVSFLKTLGGQRRFTPEQIQEIKKQHLTSDEAAIELGVSPSTLRRWASRDLIPYTTDAAGHRRFTWANVRAIRELMTQLASVKTDQQAA